LAFSGEAQEFYFDIPRGYSASARRTLAELAISRIIERTEQAIGANNESFPDLEPDYAIKKAQMGGVPIPNLRLSGELHSDLEYKPSKSSSEKICVGYKANTESNAKAHGHRTGFDGKNKGKIRDFLGLPQNEIDSLVASYEPDEADLLSEAIQIKDLIGRIAQGVGFEEIL
jgi:hypothetical protein